MKAFDPTLFVNREKELNSVRQAIKALVERGALLRDPLIEFYGASGTGKTWLLLKIKDECERFPCEKGIITALIDFKEMAGQSLAEIVEKLVNQIGWDGYNSSVKCKEASAKLKATVTQCKQAQCAWDDEAQEAFIGYMSFPLKKGWPIALFFDTLDRADETAILWLQNSIRDLVDVGKLLVILGSKVLITFEGERDVARKLRPFRLHPFGPDEVREQWGDKSIEELIGPIFELTAGHPMASDVVFEIVEKMQIRNGDDFEAHKEEIINALIEGAVDGWMLEDVTERERYKEILTPLCVPRQFNALMVRQLIEEFALQHSLVNLLHYLDLVGELVRETRLVEATPENRYAIDRTIRNILLARWKLHNLEDYSRANELLIKLYEKWLEEVKGLDRNRYLLELVFHMANVGKSSAEIQKTFGKHLAEYEDLEEIQFLLEDLETDDELKATLGDEIFDELVRMTNDKIKALASVPKFGPN